MALPTKGRVIIDTTAGEFDIELWSKETPKTCRNFIALAMEGYYDGVIFHRVVPDFLVQTGDRTGSGSGGESFYGEPFEDEIHPRLRYSHRGLVGMANAGRKNSNDSQFFITLDRADELHGKHTLFGRCVGDTIFNVMKIGSMELDGEGRPLYPPKIKTIRIIENPFPDIIPRITAAEKRAQQRAREQMQKERVEEIRRKGAKKDTKLLSFQDEEAAEPESISIKKKAIVRPDLVDEPDQLSISLKPEFLTQPSEGKTTIPRERSGNDQHTKGDSKAIKSEKMKGKDTDASNSVVGLREKIAKERSSIESERQQQISKLEKEIKKLESGQAENSGSDLEEARKKKRQKKSYLDEELAKYQRGRGMKGKKDGKRKTRDESSVLTKMDAFRSKLKMFAGNEDEGELTAPEANKQLDEMPREEEAIEVDRDIDFLAHKLYFPKDNTEEVMKAEKDYEVIDPRQRSARAKEEERERRQRMRPRDGGRGYRR